MYELIEAVTNAEKRTSCMFFSPLGLLFANSQLVVVVQCIFFFILPGMALQSHASIDILMSGQRG